MVTVSFLPVSWKHDLLLDIPVKLILAIDCTFVECATKSNGILFSIHSSVRNAVRVSKND